MSRNVLYISALSILVSCSTSCIRKPGRPNTEHCYWLNEAQSWECQDAYEHKRPETPNNLTCTTLDGYLVLERYVDSKEKRVRELERELSQCRK